MALLLWYKQLNNTRLCNKFDKMKGSFLGPKYSNDYIRNELNEVGAKYQEVDDDELIFITTEELKNNSAIGWFQGRMEFDLEL